jgi:hypothetical protein
MPNIAIQEPLSSAVKYLVVSGSPTGVGGILDISYFPNIQTVTVNTPNVGLSGFFISPTVNTGIKTIALNNGNNITGVIADYSVYQYLSSLNLSNNKYTGINDFSTLNNSIQTYLIYGNTGLSGSCPNFNNLAALTNLSFSTCNFTGNLPSFSNLSALNTLNIANCKLTGIIPDMSAMTGFGTGIFQSNNLTGFAGTNNFPTNGLPGFYFDASANKITATGMRQIIISAANMINRSNPLLTNGTLKLNGGTNASVTGDGYLRTGSSYLNTITGYPAFWTVLSN